MLIRLKFTKIDTEIYYLVTFSTLRSSLKKFMKIENIRLFQRTNLEKIHKFVEHERIF